MKNYYLSIDGWAQDGAQGKLFRDLLGRMDTSKPLRIVEVGVYKGRMTALICEILAEMGINAEYHCVDHFLGSEEHERKDYYPDFESAIFPLTIEFDGVRIYVHRSDSVLAAQNDFQPQSCDIVYVDASHDYESAKRDIDAWVKVVKPGGYLCGDDYVHCWPGVIKAVNEYFGAEKVGIVSGSQWFKQITK